MRRATLVAVLAWFVAAGCTGDGVATPDSVVGPPVDTNDVLVQLPPAPSLLNELRLGTWDWGAPCRVPVREVVGSGGPPIARTFTIAVTADPSSDGFVMAFDDVDVELRGRGEEYWAVELHRYMAVLTDMRLDADGRFVEFVGLDATLADLTARAGVTSPDSRAAILARQPMVTETILDRTYSGWFGFWLDHARLPLNPDRLVGERQRRGSAGPERATTEAYAGSIVTDGPWGQQAPGAIWLTYSERSVHSATGRIDVSAIVDPTNRRPTYVVLRLAGFDPSETSNEYSPIDRRVVTFDWENAEGCT